MIGTLLNFALILVGGLIGLVAGKRIPLRFRETLISGLGLFTFAYGVSLFAKTANLLIPLVSLVLGIIVGEALKIEERLDSLGVYLKSKFDNKSEGTENSGRRFIDGFVTTSLLFCIGPMAILGSIQDGLTGNFQMLAIKSILDGLASIAFASSLGVGVLFSAGMVLVYQGAISLIAMLAGKGLGDAAILEMTAVGGLLLMGIGAGNLLGLKKIRTGSFLPALFFAVAIVLLLNWLGIAY